MEKKTSRKIDLTKKRESKAKRSVSFSKRRQGLFNKAAELYMLCDAQLAVLVSSPCSKPNRKIYSFAHPSVNAVLDSFLDNQVPDTITVHDKNRALNLWNEIKGLETEIREISSKNLTGVCSIFDSLEKSESIQELKNVVDGLEKLIVKARDKSVISSMNYGSCSKINDACLTIKTDSNDDEFMAIQDYSGFGYDFGTCNSLSIADQGNNFLLEQSDPISCVNYSELKGKQVNYDITPTNYNFGGNINNCYDSNYSILDHAAANHCYSECSSDMGALEEANQDVISINEFKNLFNYLWS
ncbi:agamous-like MADS-box protein AGL97 [Mercurialis annua]|uniref:agamous-like MADS-box protein AGL97 n=1 Tax=Mercurialis annua TaxID=3986 RepID=UPI00215FF97E|nr:agamous-like MADS-box protein AGL97 [Mercurialis annua]